MSLDKPRTVHGFLWLKNFIFENRKDVIILCGSKKAFDEIWPLAYDGYRCFGTHYWVAYPGQTLPGNSKFEALVIDNTWNGPNDLSERDWAENQVISRFLDGSKTFWVP